MKVSPEHDALLRACTSRDTDFASNLLDWERIQDINTIDFASMRLIPFLYRKAERLGVQMANMGICKGLYLRAWYLHTTNKIPSIDWIEKQDVFESPILLKGAALQYTIYQLDPPLRPSDDVDILIPKTTAKKVLEFLENQDFRTNHVLSRSTILDLRNGVNYYGQGKSIDIHWGIFPVCLDPDFTNRVSNRSIKVTDRISVLSYTDNLIHCLIHGYGRNEIPPIRWVLDAHLLITSGMVDWNLFWEEIVKAGWHRIVIQQLDFLSRYDITIPAPRRSIPSVSLVMAVTEVFLKSNNFYLRRVLRLLGYDYGVWAQNTGIKPSILNYFKTSPDWLKLLSNEWREFKSKKV